MAHTSRAWVMDVGAGWRVAAGASHVVEYLLAPETIDVPRTPGHCAGLLIWRDHMIPVIDFAPLPAERRGAASDRRHAIILAYQEAPAQPLRFGALLVTAAPTETWVSDDMAGQLAQMPAAFRQVARACFVQHDRAIPILDPRRLFTRSLPRLRAPYAEVDERVIHLVERTPTPSMVPATDVHGCTSVAEAPYGEADGARRTPGATDEMPRSLSVAQIIPVGRTSPTEAPSPVLSLEPSDYPPPAAGFAGMDGIPPAYGATTACTPGRPADGAAAAPESVPPVNTGDLSEFVPLETDAPTETASAASPPVERTADTAMAAPLHGGGDATSTGITAAAVMPEPSSTLQSFRRLHAMVQDIEIRDHRRHSRRGQRRWWLLGAGLTMAAGALFMSMDFSAPAPAPAPAKVSVARDVAPNGIHPASVPSTPAQPPQ